MRSNPGEAYSIHRTNKLFNKAENIKYKLFYLSDENSDKKSPKFFTLNNYLSQDKVQTLLPQTVNNK